MEDSAAETARVKLLTLLNVAATRRHRDGTAGRKRKDRPEADENAQPEARDWRVIARSAASKVDQEQFPRKLDAVATASTSPDLKSRSLVHDGATKDDAGAADTYDLHFGPETSLLSAEVLASVDGHAWSTETLVPLASRDRVEHLPQNSEARGSSRSAQPTPANFDSKGLPSEFQRSILSTLEQYKDLWVSDVGVGQELATARQVVASWLVQHIIKTRNRVLKNNDYLARHGGSGGFQRETRDQGFTRPKILLLVPFRSSALAWIQMVIATSPTDLPPRDMDRFIGDYSLPAGAIDKLADEAFAQSRYPADHRETFKGNIDDDFRIGVKFTRKEIRLFSNFYSADMIVASPVGLRTLIEKDGNSDFLSSIEIVAADQLDVMQMQNWDHLAFIFERLNRIPAEARGADFSRIKPWYLDSRATHLRQTVLLSAFSTPDTRALFRSLTNVAGKQQWETGAAHVEGVLDQVQVGVKQVWHRFESEGIETEEDERWTWFREETLTGLMRSAVASSSGTLIFVPSYYDFVRMADHLGKIAGLEFASISEYSTNAEISRARSAFFNGQVPVLVLTERFYFYRRYKIRGARTIVFYAPPEHAVFYAEILAHPFLPGRSEVDSVEDPPLETVQPEEVTVQVLFSRWDTDRVARIVGSKDASRMMEGSASTCTFA